MERSEINSRNFQPYDWKTQLVWLPWNPMRREKKICLSINYFRMISFLPFNTCWCLLKDYKYLNKYVYKIYFSTYLSRYDFLADTRRDQNSSKQQDQNPFSQNYIFLFFWHDSKWRTICRDDSTELSVISEIYLFISLENPDRLNPNGFSY